MRGGVCVRGYRRVTHKGKETAERRSTAWNGDSIRGGYQRPRVHADGSGANSGRVDEVRLHS